MNPKKGESFASGGSNSLVADTGHEMFQVFAERGIKSVAPQVDTVYGDEINLNDFEYAIAVPVGNNVTEDVELPTKGTMILREMPAVHAATIVVKGINVGGHLETKVLIQRWAIENGYTLCNEMRVIFFQSMADDIPASERVFELQVIVEPQAQKA
jgi:hypothetical protein